MLKFIVKKKKKNKLNIYKVVKTQTKLIQFSTDKKFFLVIAEQIYI